MEQNDSPKDLNELALNNLRELIVDDDELLPEWKTKLAANLKDDIPQDVSALEDLVALDQRHDSTQET